MKMLLTLDQVKLIVVNFGGCLKRQHVNEASSSRPRSRTAKINFGFKSTIVYERSRTVEIKIYFDLI